MNNGRPQACANIYKHGRLKTRKEMIEDGTMKSNNEEITFDELKSFKYMFEKSPIIATIVVSLNILIVVALGYIVF